MGLIDFNKEFVERTKWIIENVSCKYEITLLLNCMLALVSLPIERTGNMNDADKEFQRKCIAKLNELNVVKKHTSTRKTFRTIKNALSHMHITPVNANDKICFVEFDDKLPGANNFHTKLKFSVSQLKNFALYVAELHLERFDRTPQASPTMQ